MVAALCDKVAVLCDEVVVLCDEVVVLCDFECMCLMIFWCVE